MTLKGGARETYELLSTAFPVDERSVPRCNWCGSRRSSSDRALCANCWYGVPGADRRRYMELGIVDRAKWILANKPMRERRLARSRR